MKIAIAGFGLEGESSYHYYSSDPTNDISIVDQRKPERELPRDVKTIIGDDALENLQDFDLVIRTAGLSPHKIKTNGKIWSATNEFFAKCPAKIVGITGTKGKGTTASIIANILKLAGKKVWLLGNIGEAALDAIRNVQPSDVVVYELSSFQLWDLEKSPHIAVVLFIEQEHLDVHTDMKEYLEAKSNIANHQTSADLMIFKKSNQYSIGVSSKSAARLLGYPDEVSAHVKDNNFYYGEQKICSVDILKIVGPHNYDNACAAIDAVWEYTQDLNVIKEGLGNFKGLPHRLQFIREVNGVKYYDDSIATTPSAAIAALKSFDEPKLIILGGSSKGSDFTELGKELLKHNSKAILIGNEAETIAHACDKAGFKNYEIMDKSADMEKIVEKSKILTKPGSVVLLSPASASFDMFKNYVDRGEQFIKAVNSL